MVSPIFACLTSLLNFQNIFNQHSGYISAWESFWQSLKGESNNLKIFVYVLVIVETISPSSACGLQYLI